MYLPKGLNPIPTEHQIKEIDKLNQKLSTKAVVKTKKGKDGSTVGEEEIDEPLTPLSFDLKSKTRVIAFEGPLAKRSKH